jgi:hypothetical protein
MNETKTIQKSNTARSPTSEICLCRSLITAKNKYLLIRSLKDLAQNLISYNKLLNESDFTVFNDFDRHVDAERQATMNERLLLVIKSSKLTHQQ